MTAMEILEELKRRGIFLEAHGDRLRFRPKEMVTSDLLEIMRARKVELLQALRVPARVRGQDSVIQSTNADVCFHCRGKKLCRCALCGVSTTHRQWAHGQCTACKGAGWLCWPERLQ